jgi:hypothetical protein
MRWRTKIGIAVFFAALVAAAALNIYFIRDDSGGSLLWNGDKAYLFVGVARRGFHCSYLAYPWALAKESLFYAPAFPADDAEWITVVEVTQSSVKRSVVDVPDPRPGIAPGEFTPLEGAIYANCPRLGGLCKWAGDHFEAASREEQQKFGGIERLSFGEFDNVNGWSERIMLGNGRQFVVEVGGTFSILVKNHATGAREYPKISIDLVRSGGVPEQLWYLDEAPRSVSRSAYKRAFRLR